MNTYAEELAELPNCEMAKRVKLFKINFDLAQKKQNKREKKKKVE